MKKVWIKTKKGEQLVNQYEQADSMPKTEEVLGGIDTTKDHSKGWAMWQGKRIELLRKSEPRLAKIDVEEYLFFHGILNKRLTTLSPV